MSNTTSYPANGISFQPKGRILHKGADYSCPEAAQSTYVKELHQLNISVLPRGLEQQLARKAKKGDRHSREKLIQCNLRLVVAIAKKLTHQYPQYASEFHDLLQEGNAALIHAIDKFDPNRGIKLSTYATWWIYQAMQTHLQGVHRPYRVPGNALTHLNTLKRAKENLTDCLGNPPTDEQLAQHLGWSLAKISNVQSIQNQALPFDAPLQPGESPSEGLSLSDRIASNHRTPEETLAEKQERHTLHKAWESALDAREQDILMRHFGIILQPITNETSGITCHATSPEPLHAIGKDYNVSREAIRKSEKKALKKLKKALTSA